MITGTTAPPMIPVLKIPENEPWCSATELRPSDTKIGHITDANSPIAGNANRETLAGPKIARVRQTNAPEQVPISTCRLSKRFSNPIPIKQPAVRHPLDEDPGVDPGLGGANLL